MKSNYPLHSHKVKLIKNYSVYKFCPVCNDYFESMLLTPNRYCEIHQSYLIKDINYWMKSRTIAVRYFDVFAKIYDGKMGRVCRICGSPLQNKNGSNSKNKRFCNNCSYKYFDRYIWKKVRFEYLKLLIKKQKKIFPEIKSINGRKRSPKKCSFYCEKCFKLIDWKNCEVHHVKQIHTYDESNYLLCWDMENLNALCMNCHNDSKKKKKM
ncbi:MAG: HNH endonuclease [archaeon]|nr:HNH endonuclease [archaeon]